MEEKMIAIDGRSLQVSCTGVGPVTLLILSGSNILFPGLEYAPLADALSPWYSVLIPSKFGYGHSGLTDAPRDVDTVVEEYRGVLAALERPLPVVLAAHSMGFLEALHWARKYPEEVSVLVGLDPAVPQVYQHMELDAVHRRLEDLHRSSWKRRLLFRLTSRALLKRFPASERRELAPAARRNFVSVVWVNEARDLPRSIRQVQQEGPPASVPALFLVSNGKGTPLPQEEWRMCARTYLSAFSVSSLHLLDLPHDLYRCRPQELADTIHRFLSDHL
ncbi:alpha/beta hydrolase [Clostridiales bacterium]